MILLVACIAISFICLLLPSPRDYSIVTKLAFVGSIAIACVVACTPAQQAKAISGGTEVALCIIEHEGETPEQIAKDCGVTAVKDVISVIDAQHAMMAKRCPTCVACDAGVHDAGRDVNAGPGK